MHIINLEKVHWDLLKLLSWNWNTDVLQEITSKLDEICPLAIPKQISTISTYTYQIWWKSVDIYSSYSPEMKIPTCHRQITISKLMKFDRQQSKTRALQYQCTHQVWWKSTNIYSNYRLETKILTDGQTNSRTHRQPTWYHNTPSLCGWI